MPALYCTCGAGLWVPLPAPRRAVRVWQQRHQGPGHEVTDAATTARPDQSREELEWSQRNDRDAAGLHED